MHKHQYTYPEFCSTKLYSRNTDFEKLRHAEIGQLSVSAVVWPHSLGVGRGGASALRVDGSRAFEHFQEFQLVVAVLKQRVLYVTL